MGPVGLQLRVLNKDWRQILIIREDINKSEGDKMAEVVESKGNGSENQKKKKKGEEKKMCSLDIPLFNTKRRVMIFVVLPILLRVRYDLRLTFI
jgi:hypothetical protein